MKVFIDFETYFDPKNGYGLKTMSMVEFIRDSRFKTHGLGVQIEDRKPEWITASAISTYCRDLPWDEITLVGHNIKFDAFILNHVYGIVAGAYEDTKGLSRAILAKTVKNHSLMALALHFGFEPKGSMKTEGLLELTEEQEKELAEYCLHDVELCYQIYSKLRPQFPDNQLKLMDWTIRSFVCPKLLLDKDLLVKTEAEEISRKANIFSLVGIEKSVFSSNDQFANLLVKEGYEVPVKPSPRKKGEDGKPLMIPALAVGDPDFLDMMQIPDDKLKALCEARVAAKSTLMETRSGKLAKIASTGPWPFDIEFSGATQTHRFSGGSGGGGNPQNFTRGSALRKAVYAPDGYKLIVADFSNIELRIVAYLSQDIGIISAIESKSDIYCDFASSFFGRKITKKDETERRFGKTAILGLGYGMGFKKFQKTVRLQTGITINEFEARRAIDLYRSKYIGVPKLWDYLDRSIPEFLPGEQPYDWRLPVKLEKCALVLPSGLRMLYPELKKEGKKWSFKQWGKGALYQETANLYGGKILENVAQALAGELCKEVAVKFIDCLTGLVHDEIHLMVREEDAEEYADELYREMTAAPTWLPQLKLDAEVGIGKNWLECK